MSIDLSLRALLSSSSLSASESRVLMAYVLNKHYQLPRSALLSRDDMELNTDALNEWKTLEMKRLQGQPIAYLLGKKGFHNIELEIGPGVLIPRPETELLVDIGLGEVKKLEQEGRAPKILDLGTGSGAIALAIAHNAPLTSVMAIDQSEEALTIAKKNARLLGLESRVQFSQGSWYQALGQETLFDMILSNPPYIANGDPHLTQGDLRFEPISALTDHATGLTSLEEIIRGAWTHLEPAGLIAVEHGFDQSEAVVKLMQSAKFTEIQTHQDLAGHNRVVSGRK